jgi:hypothetical protein
VRFKAEMSPLMRDILDVRDSLLVRIIEHPSDEERRQPAPTTLAQ